MGCLVSTPKGVAGNRRLRNIGEIAVFAPGLRVPKNVDFSFLLSQKLSKSLVDRLSALRSRIIIMSVQGASTPSKSRRKNTTQQGGSTLTDLLQALQEYLPVLLGLVKNGGQFKSKVPFAWINQEDDSEETIMEDAWYEVLSILQLMAALTLSEANLLLLPRNNNDGYQPRVSEEDRRASIDVLLKAAGYLECAIQDVLPKIPANIRGELPVDLTEGVLRALCLQALGQSVDVQLGIAIETPKATLAVKRRLACEMVKYWNQAEDCLTRIPLTSCMGEKHSLFVKWKNLEAKAAAYYYHGLILDEGNTEKSHGMAVSALRAAENFIKESKMAKEAFNNAHPISRSPPLWGSMKYLSDKIIRDASSKIRDNEDLYRNERVSETAPALPDFALALAPDDYQLPQVDNIWNEENNSRQRV